jgi:uncharacterized membrane protein
MEARIEFQDRGEDTSRIGALSDSIFGVALTLLVLDLRLPEPAAGVPLARTMLLMWPKFWSYGLTFAVLGAFWISHHRMLHLVARYNRPLLGLNLLVLSLIALVPLPTSLLSHFSLSHTDAQTAWTMYSVNLALIGLSLFWVWRYALANDLVKERVSLRLASYMGVRTLVVPAMFFLSIVLSFASLLLAFVSPILIPPVMAVVQRSYVH